MNNYLKELEIKLKGSKKTDYNTIDRLMKSIGKKYNIDMKTLHNDFIKKHNQSPDSWIKRMRGEKIKPTKECGCSVEEGFKKNLTPEQISKKHNISLKTIKQQLIKGIRVEKEHTNDTKIAEKIALQHLDEYPDYYTRLKKIETKKTFEEFILEASPAWQRKAGKNPKGGLNKKGIASYRKQHPGSKLSLAVTTKPSKLKKGSKKWKRRKSFCSRMLGMRKKLTSAKTARDPNSRINKSLRKWNC